MAYKDPFEIADECIAFGVHRVSRAVTGHFDRHLAAAGLRVTQFTLLNALSALGEVTIGELAGQLLADRTTLNRNLKLLQERGWARNVPNPDRRKRCIGLTPEGRKRLADATPAWQAAQETLTSRLGNSRYRRLMEDLSELEAILA